MLLTDQAEYITGSTLIAPVLVFTLVLFFDVAPILGGCKIANIKICKGFFDVGDD